MTEIKDPGAPRTDALAENQALSTVTETLLSTLDGTSFTEDEESASFIAAAVVRNHTVTWETDINSEGVPVRRYVLRGTWEVDPDSAELPRVGDTVRYRAGYDQEIQTIDHGTVPEGSDWIVFSVLGMGIALLGMPGWPKEHYINTGVGRLEIVKRAGKVQAGDTVIFTDRRDGGREWTVGRGPATRWVNITAPGADEVAEVLCAGVGDLTVVRRP